MSFTTAQSYNIVLFLLAGDGSTQENDCEFDGYDRRFTIHRSDKAPVPLLKILHSSRDFLHKRASFIISDEQVFWTNHNGDFDFVKDPSLFALNGQEDRQGPINYDVFFSMNRVINGSYRHGHGLCRAAIRWL